MVRLGSASDLGRYDALYVAAHAHDVPLSCAGRLLSEAGRGLRILLVTLFDTGDGPRAADALPVDHHLLGFPDAPRRDGAYATFCSVTYGWAPADDELVPRLAALLEDLAHRIHARHVYAPLGVGGHADHRLAHEAAHRAFHDGAERDVFFYEDRPRWFTARCASGWARSGRGCRRRPSAPPAPRGPSGSWSGRSARRTCVPTREESANGCAAGARGSPSGGRRGPGGPARRWARGSNRCCTSRR